MSKNGQAQETSRRLDSSNVFDQPEGLGGLQDSSSVNGIEQVRPNQADRSKEDNHRRTSKHGDVPAAKVLERLKRIEDRYLSHLKAHQRLLKSQLNQTEQEEDSFRKEVQELEEEIYNLASSEGKSPLLTEKRYE
ncbi:MAG: hypothetical protein HEQ35_05680 [Gloeotrichia echinulata IR180]